MLPRIRHLATQMAFHGGTQGVLDQGALARATDPGDGGQGAQGNGQVHILQVEGPRASQAQELPVSRAAIGTWHCQ